VTAGQYEMKKPIAPVMPGLFVEGNGELWLMAYLKNSSTV